ncbi:Hpt domain-containing protein [Paenarthrobacter sp. UW852]|uniref:Hpt domain-containing protein n=1 Tax=Paenarthrobacter sp. UW852 TaxID=2951989 RepID=UPI002147BF68|nr:Hpt domain-containing protein [Paenarthrobacter sp. UW852]MCR1161023.1 Hpt domain-containing protein [Paenarthrobacter sp. UW852]
MSAPRNNREGLDLDRLRSLADDLGDPAPALRFLTKYLSMLTGRVERIARAVEQGDEEETTNAVLSLKISSAMVGALETEHQCRAIESMIREDHFDYAADALPALRQTADRCVAARSDLISAAHASMTRHGGFFRA